MRLVADHREVSTFVGTPKEVQAHLRKSHASRVLLVEFENLQPDTLQILAENLDTIASSVLEVLLERQGQKRQERETQERLAGGAAPHELLPPRRLKKLVMRERARIAVLKSTDWLTADDIVQSAGISNQISSTQPSEWTKQGLIFSINRQNIDYFPGYGLDPDTGFQPVKALAKIIEIFDGHKDGWGMAYWFCSDNSFLGGKPPQSLLASAPEQVIAAAFDEVQEIAHG